MLGLIFMASMTPVMSAGHFLFTVLAVVYIIVGTLYFEEHRSVRKFKDYEEYRKTTPAFCPFFK